LGFEKNKSERVCRLDRETKQKKDEEVKRDIRKKNPSIVSPN